MAYQFSSVVAACGLLVVSGFAGVSGAMAQSAAPQRQPQQQAAISQEELKSFAVAAKEVQKINQSYMPSYQSAQTDEQKKAIEREAMGKMTQAVKEKGLTVEKYNQIVQVAQSDPEVARKVDEYAREPSR